MRYFIYDDKIITHGTQVICKITDSKGRVHDIKDGRISISSNGSTYICQDVVNGAKARDRLGYSNSWYIGYISTLSKMPKDISDFNPIKNDDYEVF